MIVTFPSFAEGPLVDASDEECLWTSEKEWNWLQLDLQLTLLNSYDVLYTFDILFYINTMKYNITKTNEIGNFCYSLM